MTSTDSSRLSPEDRQLLREVFCWARANGWRAEAQSPEFHIWRHRDGREVDVYFDGNGSEMTVETATRRSGVWYPMRIAEAVDVLVALGILPQQFSSAFAAGRESLGQLWATDERPAYTTRLWADDGDTWAHGSSGALRGTPEFEQSVIADAKEQIGPWDDTCHIVRVEVQRFREVTYRVDPTVIARFGDWEKVPDA